MNTRRLLLVLWLCFVLRGIFYCVAFPVWEGFDEPSHFAFIQYVSSHRGLPVASTPVSREVEASLHLLPLSWEQRLHVIAPPIFTEDSYWRLPPQTRAEMQRRVQQVSVAEERALASAPTMYEAQQAPLYYWLMSVPVRLAEHWGLPARVMLLRILSLLVASLIVPIAYATAIRVLGRWDQAIGVVAVLVCMPELMIDICRVGNDSLSVLLFSLLTLLLVRAVEPGGSRWFGAAGVVLGLGLLTKAYFLVAIPVFIIVAVYAAVHERPSRAGVKKHAAAGLVLATAISFFWYWRNLALTRSLSGEENDAAAAHGGLTHTLASIAHVKWLGGVTSVLVSHIWFGGWSFLKLPKPIYAVFAFAMAISAFGVVRLIASDRFRSGTLFAITTLYTFFWVGLLYDVLVIYIATGISSSTGWYLYAAVLPEVLLAALGLYALTPRRWHGRVLPAIALAFAAVDLFGMYYLLLPYYTGIITHMAGSDVVRPALVLQLLSNVSTILQRLTTNKPAFLSPGLMLSLMILYSAATVAPVFLAQRAASAKR
jgi:4-amino-4-deoxy-L-arabinose transferase-like glycosyltransferase